MLPKSFMGADWGVFYIFRYKGMKKSKIKEIFSGKEKEDGPLDISKGISSRRYKADELEL